MRVFWIIVGVCILATLAWLLAPAGKPSAESPSASSPPSPSAEPAPTTAPATIPAPTSGTAPAPISSPAPIATSPETAAPAINTIAAPVPPEVAPTLTPAPTQASPSAPTPPAAPAPVATEPQAPDPQTKPPTQATPEIKPPESPLTAPSQSPTPPTAPPTTPPTSSPIAPANQPAAKPETTAAAASTAPAVVPAVIIANADGTTTVDGKYTVKGDGSKEKPYEITWEQLTSAQEIYNPREGKKQLPERVTMLDGKYVTITGYIAFPLYVEQPRELLSMLNQWDGCCIGVPPTPYDAIEVKLLKPVVGDARYAKYGSVTGRFAVKPYLAGDWLVGLYLMENATVSGKEFGGFGS